jgi:carboxymethylenebutenolidase
VAPPDIAAQIDSPVLGLYGEADLGISIADVKEIEAALKAAGKTAEFVLHPGSATRVLRGLLAQLRPEVAKDAWGRSAAWFSKYLKG